MKNKKDKNDNKKIIIPIILIVLVVIGACLLLANKKDTYREELKESEKELIAEKAYINYAWGFQYKGMAIFNDGTIYKWDLDGRSGDYKKDGDTWENVILKYGKKIGKKVTNEDLLLVEKNIKNLEGECDSVSSGNDRGSNYISVNKDGKMVVIKKIGDFTGENKHDTAQKLIKLIEKYL